MSDISVFLKDRLDEDEQIANTSIRGCIERAEWSYEEWTPGSRGGSGEVIAPNDRDSSGYPEMITRDAEGMQQAVDERDGPHIARHDPARVLREVAAKRAIIEAYMESGREFTRHMEAGAPVEARFGAMQALEHVIRNLATVYADHPDYREEWNI